MDCTCQIKYIEDYEPEPKVGSGFLYGKNSGMSVGRRHCHMPVYPIDKRKTTP